MGEILEAKKHVTFSFTYSRKVNRTREILPESTLTINEPPARGENSTYLRHPPHSGLHKTDQYIKSAGFAAKVFLTFNPMPGLADAYPDLLAPDTGIPLLLTMFRSPGEPSGTETPWYWVTCKLHPYQVEFQRTIRNSWENTAEELEREKFSLALPWEGAIELYAILLPIRFRIGHLS